MEVSGYCMDLYCDTDNQHKLHEFPHTFTGETRQECKRQATRAGWKFIKDFKVICPICSKGVKPLSQAIK